ncbi:hypothetical protein GYMLUDRAFT_45180 [Collybiopsis luxurians FD-317 M1]|uniref:Uncharacterized protein n=1 Tax=Collybiopsis luxurians FD-317 M1 TaxID=944289 RepID=A0A0D0CSC7_9AGAR|nr:hypothetical protein GYMLUDRAFT_45180 [Collybiopsis luxurians FD-317 M1]
MFVGKFCSFLFVLSAFSLVMVNANPAPQDEGGLGPGETCGTIVGTQPCIAGYKCCYISPDNGICVRNNSYRQCL